MISTTGPTSRLRLTGTPNMGVGLWGVSPLYDIGNSWEGRIPTVRSSWEVRGEGNCGSGDRPWGGSLRVCRQADKTWNGKNSRSPRVERTLGSKTVVVSHIHAEAARLRTETS